MRPCDIMAHFGPELVAFTLSSNQIVDENGEPKVFYHGTFENWTEYDLQKNVNQMWGNGISLPTALYVMQGIAEALKGVSDEKENT